MACEPPVLHRLQPRAQHVGLPEAFVRRVSLARCPTRPVCEPSGPRSSLGKRAAEYSGHLPLVALTAYTAPIDRTRSLEAGMDDFISKPVQPLDVCWRHRRLGRRAAHVGAAAVVTGKYQTTGRLDR
jgi:hypothetical protein